ncbi:hypothetical protein [Alkalinema sp. FACHB-956]|uniref:hypothetical protein n=1 Tax=Alkalinema sp. FACHB-956 TaxID=2692768 RepID=UPI001683F130|nr:hypothetical protein [Alkalinema sp. FACHB-956]MBD2327119.1 hypothetical protein [Alkalinema sp. FACHB-956]
MHNFPIVEPKGNQSNLAQPSLVDMFKPHPILSLVTIALTLSPLPTPAAEMTDRPQPPSPPSIPSNVLQTPDQLPTIHTRAEVEQYQQQRVKLIGQYIATRRKPNPMNTGIVGFKGDYITAKIMLQDGTDIAINSPMLKQSLRSEKEAQQYDQKQVEVIGRLEMLENSTENRRSQLYIVLESIHLPPDQPDY